MTKELNNQTFSIIDNRQSVSHWNKDKYTKFLVTIALRLGVAIKDDGNDINLKFSGIHSEHNNHHESDNYIGSLIINKEGSIDNVKICTHKNGASIATLWPMHDDSEKQQQSKDSKTSEFIEYYVDGDRLFTIEDIATYYHPVFLEKPGLSPLALEKEVCARKEEALRELYSLQASELTNENKTLKEIIDSQIKQNTKENNNKLQADVSEIFELAKPGQTVISRPRKILKSVKLKEMSTKNRGVIQGVILHFDDGTTLANNWDNGSERKKVIDKLVGREVITDVWGDYSDSDWFANVYLK